MGIGINRGHHNLYETYVDIRMLEIQCFICKKTVDMVVRKGNMETNALRYTVHCHGDTDTCIISRRQIEEGDGRIEPGYAFTTKRIDGERERMDMSSVYEGSCEEIVEDPLLLRHDDEETN